MTVLGIETSCDETSAAIVENGKFVLSNIVASSLKEHKKFGGIIPEIASRRQLELINTVVRTAFEKAGVTLNGIDGIAVTQSPGLIGSLLVGLSYARALSFAADKPLAEIDHIKAHLYANFLVYPHAPVLAIPSLPAVGLIVSGGHSSLYFIRDHTRYTLLGRTRDDAAGEAFDKVARILGLGYPGGPIIDRIASRQKGSPLRFQPAQMPGTFDFSFSGVKTAVLYHKQKHQGDKDYDVGKISYSFQDSVVSVLVRKSIEACNKKRVKTLLVGGGVAANSALRRRLADAAEKTGINVSFPPMEFCIDNAAMIAGLGYHYFLRRNS